jgi:hypothetical protein
MVLVAPTAILLLLLKFFIPETDRGEALGSLAFWILWGQFLAWVAFKSSEESSFRRRVEGMAQALTTTGVIRESSNPAPTDRMGNTLPKDIEINGGLINFVKPFSQPPILSAFRFNVWFRESQLGQCLKLTDEELAATKNWSSVPFEITWERWSGRHERLIMKFTSEQGIFDRERSRYRVDAWEDWGILWSQNVADGKLWLEIHRGKIRLYAWDGRFGEDFDDDFFGKSFKPKEEYLLIQVPLSEKMLIPFEKETEEKELLWEPKHGRPPKYYGHEDDVSGIDWSLEYHFDMRPLALGWVEQVKPDSANYNLVSFDFGSGAGGEPRKIWQRFDRDMGVGVGEQVYVVFDEEGRIDQLWPESEILHYIEK